MKFPKHFIILLMSLIGPCLFAQDITFSLTNSENTNDGNNDFYEVDVYAQSNTGFTLGAGQIYLNYNPAAFGLSVQTNGGLEITIPDASVLATTVGSGPLFFDFYEDFIANDNTNSRFAFSWQQGSFGSGCLGGNNITATAELLFHIKIKYINGGLGTAPDLCFESSDLFTDQTFSACGPSDACGNKDCGASPGSQITDESFNCQQADTTPPDAICQDISVTLDAVGQASISSDQVDNGSSDDSGGVLTMSLDIDAFTCSEIGESTVTLTVSDPSGNSSSCTATVTVEDVLAPTALCQDISVNLDAGGEVNIAAGQVDGGSSDNCGINSLAVNPNNFDSDDVGDNLVTLSVMDASGNEASCTSTVTITDDNAPIALCQPANVELDADGMASITTEDVDAGSSAMGGLASITVTPADFDCANLGANTVTLQVTGNNGQTASCTAEVTIVDNIVPVAACQDITVSLTGGMVSVSGSQVDAGSSDNCGIAMLSVNPDQFGINDLGENPVSLIATDGSGNEDNCTAVVTVENTSAPTAVCQPVTLQLDGNGQAEITAADVDGGSSAAGGIAEITVSPSSFNCANLGSNIVVLSVTGNNGQTASCIAEVTVQDIISPVAACQDITIQLDAGGTASINAGQVDDGSNDNCEIATLTINPSNFGMDNLGDNTVTLTIMDNSGNTANCTSTVTVVEMAGPEAVCQPFTVMLDTDGLAEINATDVDGGSSPSGNSVSLSVSPYRFDCSNIGPNMVTLTITDGDGNSDHCSASVEVKDQIDPIANCRDIKISLDENGEVGLDPCQLDAGSTDNCEISSFTVSPEHFDSGDTGENMAVLTVVDGSGNSASCTGMVTITDDLSPTAICRDVNLSLDENGLATLNISEIDACSSAPGGITIIGITPNNFDCSDIGENQVTLSLTGGNGLSASCNSLVTVEDTSPPVVDCQDITLNLGGGNSMEITPCHLDIGSSDNCGIESMEVSPAVFTLNDLGEKTVSLIAVDKSGNISECTATVTVTSSVAPSAICQPFAVGLDGSGMAVISAPDIDGCSVASGGIASMNVSPAEFDCSHIGENTVTLSITGNNGQVASCETTVTVTDDLPPTVICQNVTASVDASGFATITANEVNNGSTDACGILDLSLSTTTFDCTSPNTTILTVTDLYGNQSSCVAEVFLGEGTDLPSPWANTNVSNAGGQAVYSSCSEKFVVSTYGPTLPNNDKQHSVYQEICGNAAEIIVRVEEISNLGWAGIEIREDLSPNARKVAVKTQLNNLVFRVTRKESGGFAQTMPMIRPQNRWLKLIRYGNFILGYSSINGSSWQNALTIYFPFEDCAYLGFFAESPNAATMATAVFDKVSVYQGSNLLSPPELADIQGEKADPEINADPELEVFPNPFVNETTIRFYLPEADEVSLEVYNTQGQRVRRLEGARLEAGLHEQSWNGAGTGNEPLVSGVYLVHLTTSKGSWTKKVQLIKR